MTERPSMRESPAGDMAPATALPPRAIRSEPARASAAKIRVFCIDAIFLLNIEIVALRLATALPRSWPFSKVYVQYRT